MTPAAIRTLRQSQKLTQTGFGALLGTSQGVVSDWERGIAKPSGMAINAIALLQHASRPGRRSRSRRARRYLVTALLRPQ